MLSIKRCWWYLSKSSLSAQTWHMGGNYREHSPWEGSHTLPPSHWAVNTCPSERRGKTNCSSPRVSTTTLSYVAGLVSELRLCLLPFRWPPPQLASPPSMHIRQSPSQPTSSKSSWQFSLPTYFSFHMASEHHSFHGAPWPLVGLELLFCIISGGCHV